MLRAARSSALRGKFHKLEWQCVLERQKLLKISKLWMLTVGSSSRFEPRRSADMFVLLRSSCYENWTSLNKSEPCSQNSMLQ
ncbi:hypothetical protein RRG08_021943 [Elysia crispata]|uniref:Uncharacterized protein n=1 Tax=Elysia crispata TaxID=231223 RepID=A0AAE1DXG7_9GAST|nr:hypothetical protein RRG08_021943 [Elysia crispata]